MSAEQIVFDDYAHSYDEDLSQGIAISGEDKDFFAEGRVKWLRDRIAEVNVAPVSVMDFGCGTGSATPHLLQTLKAQSVVGVDVSKLSLDQASATYGSDNTRFATLDDYSPDQNIDIAYCNGVFHHIPPQQRLDSIDYVYRSLKPRGLFAFWENNPLNPGTRYVMSRCPFDKDAVPLTSFHARRLLLSRGFKILRTDFLFIFPHVLRHLRRIEPLISRLPLGAQYQILCMK